VNGFVRTWLKPTALLAVSLPALWLAFRLLTDRLGANPIAETLNALGWWTLFLLMASLACTPLKILLGWTWPLRIRRLLGVSTFVYASLHFVFYLVVDQGLDWGEIGEDLFKRKFITVGFAAWLLMVPLAITSTNGMVKRLGFARWKLLHRLAYVCAGLGVVHFVWRVKADLTEPLIYAGALVLLLAVRAVDHLRRRPSSRSSSRSS
jgi:methionine sulfoxide reductase heme-binding subunit